MLMASQIEKNGVNIFQGERPKGMKCNIVVIGPDLLKVNLSTRHPHRVQL